MKYKHQWAVLLLLAVAIAPMTTIAATCDYPCDFSKEATMKKAMVVKPAMSASAENAKRAIANAEGPERKRPQLTVNGGIRRSLSSKRRRRLKQVILPRPFG